MPESDIKYYPILVRLLMHLDGVPIVAYRAAIVTRKGDFEVDYRLVHRFVTEYKGGEFHCKENGVLCEHYRNEALDYLVKKCRKAELFEHKTLEPVVETEINLRSVAPTLVIEQTH